MSCNIMNKYNMNHKERGIALVINIRNFDTISDHRKQLNERVWSVKDVDNLKQTLEYIEFDFQLLQDLKAEQIKVKKQALAKYVDFTNRDCFLWVVMSHGNGDRIIASNNEEVRGK